MYFFFFQAEDGIRDLVRSRGLGDVYKRQAQEHTLFGERALDRRRHLELPRTRLVTREGGGERLSLIHI